MATFFAASARRKVSDSCHDNASSLTGQCCQVAPARETVMTRLGVPRVAPSPFPGPFARRNAVSSVANGAYNGKRPSGDNPPHRRPRPSR
ncbi:unnamed protein product, partial [Iphiclides podalirius]